VSKATVMAGWDDVPHIPEAEKARLLAATPPHLRDARSKGIPRVGAGAIYPFESEAVTVADFAIPDHWPRGYGFDVGWRATAALWCAWDRTADIIYAFREYKRGEVEPAVHVAAIRAGGAHMTGASDPAARNRSQADGTRLWDAYASLGLDLIPAENAVEAGLFECWERFSSGRLKVFASLAKTLAELRLYRRDDKGRVVKENDHLMDCLRYAVATREQALVWQGTGQRPVQVVGGVARARR
jgi:hypothetical protein